MELYPLRDQWDEQKASWTARTATASWSEPGAAGIDRGPYAARTIHVPRQPLVLSIDIAVVRPWIDQGQLSVVVVPKAEPNGLSGARMLVPALPPRTSCNPPKPPARLEIDICP
jgi:hypothetical protein